jgi:YegS/Rv2252/BmrU family lipid kinase
MTLKKLSDFEPNYLQTFEGDDIIGFNVYTDENNEKVGSIKDILLNESGYFRYLVVDFGLLIFNKQVMLPVGWCRVDYNAQRIYVLGLNRKQAENLPEYNDRVLVDRDYEEQVKGVYRALANDSVLYELNDKDHQILKLYQYRLLAKRNRDKTDELALSQEIEDEINSIEAPVKKKPDASKQIEPVDPKTRISASKKETRSACLIFNPVAGNSDSEQDLAIIRRILQPKFNLDIRITTPEVNADQLARKAVEQGAELIIASGGDGTLSAVAEAVVGTGITLGVISRGTANAFATALGIPSTIEAACQTILDGTTRIIDAAYCNGKPMVLLAGIGFEAETVEQADRESKNRFGMLAYILAGLKELGNFKSFEARIETEDKVITCAAGAITIANVAPPTSVLAQGPAKLVCDDGLLDVTLVAPANSIGAIAAAYNLLQSAYNEATSKRPDTGYLRARKIKVTTNPPQKVVLDGELFGYTPVEIECIPSGLTILIPAGPEENPNENLEGLPNLKIELKEQTESN